MNKNNSLILIMFNFIVKCEWKYFLFCFIVLHKIRIVVNRNNIKTKNKGNYYNNDILCSIILNNAYSW